MSMKKFLKEFARLRDDPFTWLYEEPRPMDGTGAPAAATAPAPPPGSPAGAAVDLTPMKNKCKEGLEALNDAFKAAEEGKADDAKQALQRAKAAIDQALGGAVSPGGFGGKA